MSPEMFNRLTANIKNDNRLESLPFAAETENGLEIVSGHHRVRAARSAGITDIYIILDDTGLNRNQIMSKQLSHNSLQGEDNEQLVRQIFEMIDDANERLAAFVSKDLQAKIDRLPINNITFDADIKTVIVNFLAYEKETFEKAAEKITTAYSELYAADIERTKPFIDCMKRIGKDYEIRAMSTTFEKMAEIVLKELGEDISEDENTAVKDLVGAVYVSNEQADIINHAIQKARDNGLIKGRNAWEFLVSLCRDYAG